MAKDEVPAEELPPAARIPAADSPAELTVTRFDYGDTAQRAEMEAADDTIPDEPLEMVDAPIQLKRRFGRSDKRRNQRPLPT